MAIIDQVVNLAGAGVQTATPRGAMLKTGPYRVQISAIEEHTTQKDGETRKSFKIVSKVVDGDYAGNEQWIYLGTDFNKDGVRKQWRTLLLSCGYTTEQVDQKNLKLTDSLFLNQTACIFFKEKDQNDPTSQPDRKFIALSEYEQLAGSQEVVGHSPVKTSSAMTAVPEMAMTPPKPANAVAGLRAMIGK